MKLLRGTGFLVIDSMTHERIGDAGTGRQPHAFVVDTDGGWGYVPYMASNTVQTIDLGTFSVVEETEAVGVAPVGAALTSDGRFLAVTSYGPLPGEDTPGVTIFETAADGTLTITAQLSIGKAAGISTVGRDLWIALKDANSLLRVVGPPYTVADSFELPGGPETVTYSSTLGVLGVTCADDDAVVFVDTNCRTILGTAEAPNPRGGTPIPSYDWWVVADTEDDGLTAIDIGVDWGSDSFPIERISLGTSTSFTDITPDGEYLVADANEGDRVTFFDAESLSILTRVQTDDRPHHPRFTPDGTACYVPNMGADTVTVLNTTTLPDSPSILTTIAAPAGGAPSGCFFTQRRSHS
ncbi:MAG: hypothetical protein SVG88_01990 [Halobacteriales archaeon]|nr:hypothetical protein [Halobacteriales archaeon]